MRYHETWAGPISHVAAIVAVCFAAAGAARACPFCAATQQTLGEELQSTDAAVLAQLIKAPPPYDPTEDSGASYRSLDPEIHNATFRIVEKLKGGENLVGIETVEVPFFGQEDKEKLFLITGIRTDRIDWTTPLPLSKDAEGYVRKLFDLPEEGADRLAFFQDYLEHEDTLLAQDSYDEFARASYDAVIGLKDRMHHDKLVEWIHDVQIAPSRRRLYLTMLGVCGKASDLAMLEYYMSPTEPHYKAAAEAALAAGLAISGGVVRPVVYDAAERYERLKAQGLDAMIACYLTLKGADGLPLIEELYLKDPNGDYKDVFSAIFALRFHGEETDVIPRERLIQSMRLVLDNPTFADQVIPDLSRWEDWGVMDRLAKMFQEAEKSSFIRQPIAVYMIIAAEQEGEVGERATAHLEELRNVDKETVDAAEQNIGFGIFGSAMPRPSNDAPATPEATTTVEATRADAGASETDAAGAGEESPTQAVAAETDDSQAEVASSPEQPSKPAAEAFDSPNEAADVVAAADPSQSGVSEAHRDQQAIAAASEPAAAEGESDAIEPPSTSMLVGGTAVAVAVLAGLFVVILRGFG